MRLTRLTSRLELLPESTIPVLNASGGATPLDLLSRWRLFRRCVSPWVGGLKPAQDFVGGVLQPCIRLVKLTGRLASQLTELVAVGHMRKCPKN